MRSGRTAGTESIRRCRGSCRCGTALPCGDTAARPDSARAEEGRRPGHPAAPARQSARHSRSGAMQSSRAIVQSRKHLPQADLTRSAPRDSTFPITMRLMERALILAVVAAVVIQGQAVNSQGQTIRQYQLERDGKTFRLAIKSVPRPTLASGQVLVRVRAASLNQRDLLVMRGQYGAGGAGDMNGHIPLSDGAGEVLAVGAGARRFKVGDRVAGTFFMRWIDGPRTADVAASARGGGNVDGMLSEVIAADENSLVRIPDHLTFEEAATLPCAGVTAYRALFVEGMLKKGQFVLLEGTGGVSMFGLQFAAAAGARPIITSSSDEKLQRARQLGAAGTVNYRTNENWQREVRALTGNAGVSHVLEVGG